MEQVTVRDDGDFIVFVDYSIGRKVEYDIAVNRCNTPISLVWWIHHMCEKGWMTTHAIECFIELATQKMGLKPYEGEK